MRMAEHPKFNLLFRVCPEDNPAEVRGKLLNWVSIDLNL